MAAPVGAVPEDGVPTFKLVLGNVGAIAIFLNIVISSHLLTFYFLNSLLIT